MTHPSEGGAPAPAQNEPPKEPTAQDLDLSKFFGSVPAEAATIPDPAPSSLEKTPEPIPTPEPAKEPESESKPESEIAAALREMREDRAKRDTAHQEVQSWKGKYEALQKENESLKRASSFEDDPISYVRAHKWTPEQQTEIIQLLAYDLAPEKAPPGFMMKVLESRRAADRAKEERERTERETSEARAQEAVYLQQFVSSLDAACSSFAPGAYPANEDWYGDNRRQYVIDMFNLANETAELARSQGRVADLSAETLAATIEKQNAERLAALESRRSKRAPAAPAKPVGTTQSTGSPPSTSGLRQGGPRPPATTEDERVKRAIEAAFPAR